MLFSEFAIVLNKINTEPHRVHFVVYRLIIIFLIYFVCAFYNYHSFINKIFIIIITKIHRIVNEKKMTMQGGDKLTLNLNGGLSTTPQLSSPTTPKLCNLPSTVPLIPTPIEKNINKNESVTVTHFSDLHGGVVEKISVPVTAGSTFAEIDRRSPKLEFTTTRTSINNPFADELMSTSKTIITTTTTTSPTVKISANNPFLGSFNGNDTSSCSPEKSVKISFSILGTKNPFDDNHHHHMDGSNGDNAQHSTNNNNNNSNDSKDIMDVDDVDNEPKNTSSVSLKIDNNGDNSVTMIKMESTADKKQMNGEINATAKKVNPH